MTIAIQVLLGILLVVLLLVIALYIYSLEALKSLRKVVKKKATKEGVVLIPSGGTMDVSTLNGNQVVVPFAVNQLGGAEMTFNFWLFKKAEGDVYNTTTLWSDRIGAPNAFRTLTTGLVVNESKTCDSGLHPNDIVLFLKGDPNVMVYPNMCSTDDNTAQYKADVLVKCPLIKFDRTTDRLTVEFNTYDGPDAVQEQSDISFCTLNSTSMWSTKTRYKFSVENLNKPEYQDRWFMVTVILSDTDPLGNQPLKNKVKCKIYINGDKKFESFADGKLDKPINALSLLRQNQYPVFIAPRLTFKNGSNSPPTTNLLKANGIYLGSSLYYNYAITEAEIGKLYQDKFDPTVSTSLMNSSGTALTVFSNDIEPNPAVPVINSSPVKPK